MKRHPLYEEIAMGAVLIAGMLAPYACAKAAEAFEPTREVESMNVTVRYFHTQPSLRTACADMGVIVSTSEPGCARTYVDQGRCEIFVMRPRSSEDRERLSVIGHETLHCFHGRYHGSPS